MNPFTDWRGCKKKNEKKTGSGVKRYVKKKQKDKIKKKKY